MDFRTFLENDVVGEPLFFGCVGEAGHYLFRANGQRVPYKQGMADPQARYLLLHDAQLAPQDDKRQAATAIHRIPGAVIVAMWDYSVDSRPGSNAMFLIPGDLSDAQAVAAAEQHFPAIWKRIHAKK